VIKQNGKILIVDDESDILLSLRLLLKQHFTIIQTEKNPENVSDILNRETFDEIMLDMNFSTGLTNGRDAIELLNEAIQISPATPVIMMTAYGDIELAVKAIKDGAMDFVLKPWQNEKLLATVNAAFNLRQSKLEIQKLRNREKQLSSDIEKKFSELIGVSSAIKKVFASIEKVAQTEANVLISGENGTGKELVARAVHRHSNRSNEAFVNVDLSSIGDSNFESELFGQNKGENKEILEDKAGRFETANKGTLFLDELGSLSLTSQSKLLAAIQSKKISRQGSRKIINTDVRLICATNMPLYDMVAQNNFRQDLLYSINTVEIKLPALRERTEDIPLLTEYFLTVFCKKYNKPLMRVSAATIKKLSSYSWPGNVRELQHTMERAVIMSDTSIIQPSDFNFSLPENKDNELKPGSNNLDEIEKKAITKVLSKHAGNISHAAKELGLTRAALYRRIEKYGL
jgi:two-component system response regulator HydG